LYKAFVSDICRKVSLTSSSKESGWATVRREMELDDTYLSKSIRLTLSKEPINPHSMALLRGGYL